MDPQFDYSSELLDFRTLVLYRWNDRDFLRDWTERSYCFRGLPRNLLGDYLLGKWILFSVPATVI